MGKIMTGLCAEAQAKVARAKMATEYRTYGPTHPPIECSSRTSLLLPQQAALDSNHADGTYKHPSLPAKVCMHTTCACIFLRGRAGGCRSHHSAWTVQFSTARKCGDSPKTPNIPAANVHSAQVHTTMKPDSTKWRWQGQLNRGDSDGGIAGHGNRRNRVAQKWAGLIRQPLAQMQR